MFLHAATTVYVFEKQICWRGPDKGGDLENLLVTRCIFTLVKFYFYLSFQTPFGGSLFFLFFIFLGWGEAGVRIRDVILSN